MEKSILKQDLRITKTHKYLFDALFSLMAEKPFSAISVTDICARAMVHRTTFYHISRISGTCCAARSRRYSRNF